MATSRAPIAVSVAGLARLERGEGAELFEPRIDLRPLELAEAFHAELLAAETPHNGAVDHRPAQLAPADVVLFQVEALLRQVADETARKAIARAGGIEHRIQ